ncbi:SDR family oxidoreductase [Frondihabitans sp. VKM Ac-2883]|uniref:SDR family oxidoreductase n=1 Tax=Frondihabitans sp. VKM Ac-2883 TaxID=2783823 RepID=UPI001889E2AE|nr:SDR family NAD(P)-dependent oxidoreductase [Frondihabitans sp. VKM Ac-2883]MBF4577515.1 SDR family NAD(P)-dependent oxidoreductase [Frondihabitans sp. VKM Ac-2883]
MKTTGNTILITGAGTGMGLEAARQFSALGNTVIMVARNAERLDQEAAPLANAHTFVCDITDASQVEALLTYLRTEHPQLNMAFLNAGVTHSHRLFDGQNAYTYAAQEVETNFLSAIRLSQGLEPLLANKPKAALIITTSAAAYAPDISNPTYSATKAALHSLVASMRATLERNASPIAVVELVAPLVDSPFSEHVHSDQKMPASQVIEALIEGLEHDETDLRVGASEDLYQALRRSPEEAIQMANAFTNA